MCSDTASSNIRDVNAMGTPSAISQIGVPVRAVNRAQLYPGRDHSGAPCLYATMSQQAANFFVLQIDPATGAARQFTVEVPESNYTTAVHMGCDGRLYIGAAHSGYLFCFDPDEDELVDLGQINGAAAIFPCCIAEDDAGRLWIGSYGTADLTCYDPASGEFERYGRMDEVDMYNYPLVNVDGTVACFIAQTRPHVAVFDPHSGEKRVVGPVVDRGEGSLSLFRGDDGALYIESSSGDFRVAGMQAIPVDKLPAPQRLPTELPDGRRFRFADAAEDIHRTVEIEHPDRAVATFPLDYEAAGTDIFCLHAGPDGLVYGSSVLPEHLFRYDPVAGDIVDLGVCSLSKGEAYSMANLDGKIYISSYPAARISVYDPARPYRFGEDDEANPRDVGRIDELSYRPRATLAGPLGRIWTASLPDYGRWGGPLAWYAPQSGEKKAYYGIAGEASCYVLARVPGRDIIAVGTNIAGGSGTQPRVAQAVLFLWDCAAAEKLWEGTLDREVTAFNALVTGTDGRLYGTVVGGADGAELFAFDPERCEFGARVGLPEGRALDLGLQAVDNGMFFGCTSSCVYRFDSQRFAVEEVVRVDGGFSVAGPVVGDDLYFANGHRLGVLNLARWMG